MTLPAQQAADHWGGQDLRLIRHRENAVFRMALPDGKHAALRLHRAGYQSAAAIRSELWWCNALADTGLPVPRPVETASGTTMAEVGDQIATAVNWLAGEPFGEAGKPLPRLPEDQARRHFALGRLLARLHNATAAMTLPVDFARPRWDVDGLTGSTPFWGRFWDHPSLSASEHARMNDLRHMLRQTLQDHEKTANVMPIHADVLRENILEDNGSLSLIDFDDSGLGFPLYDLGTVLSQDLYQPNYTDLRDALCEGYGTSDTALVEWFTLARTLASVGWTMPRLAPDDPIMRSHIARALRCADRVVR